MIRMPDRWRLPRAGRTPAVRGEERPRHLAVERRPPAVGEPPGLEDAERGEQVPDQRQRQQRPTR